MDLNNLINKFYIFTPFHHSYKAKPYYIPKLGTPSSYQSPKFPTPFSIYFSVVEDPCLQNEQVKLLMFLSTTTCELAPLSSMTIVCSCKLFWSTCFVLDSRWGMEPANMFWGCSDLLFILKINTKKKKVPNMSGNCAFILFELIELRFVRQRICC